MRKTFLNAGLKKIAPWFLTVLALLTSGCMQSKMSAELNTSLPAESDTTISATDNTIKMVNAVFYQSFIGFIGAIKVQPGKTIVLTRIFKYQHNWI